MKYSENKCPIFSLLVYINVVIVTIVIVIVITINSIIINRK